MNSWVNTGRPRFTDPRWTSTFGLGYKQDEGGNQVKTTRIGLGRVSGASDKGYKRGWAAVGTVAHPDVFLKRNLDLDHIHCSVVFH